MTKKSILFCVLLTFILLAVLVAAGTGVAPRQAEAASVWTPKVTTVAVSTEPGEPNRYVEIATGEKISDESDFVFIVSDFESTDSFQYFVSREDFKNPKENADYIDSLPLAWQPFLEEDMETINGKLCYTANYKTSMTSDTLYIYFRRNYTDENSRPAVEYYDIRWMVIVNVALKEEDLGIASVNATYLKNNASVPYDGSNWIGVELRFELTTEYMKKNNLPYNPETELLSYSVDGKSTSDKTKAWFPMGSNVVSIRTSINDSSVDFRVTDIAKKYESFKSFDNVKIDPEIPVFSLSATTVDAATGSIVEYSPGSWSNSDVAFVFTDVSACISEVAYYYSDDGINFNSINSGSYVVRNTTKGLRFRAQSKAGVVYDYNGGESLNVNIDPTQPGLVAGAYTDDPDKTGATPTLKSIALEFTAGKTIIQTDENGLEVVRIINDAYTATADANGIVYIDLYNMNKQGESIKNPSSFKMFYGVSVDGGEFGGYTEATQAVDYSENGEGFKCYRFTDSITEGVSSARTYRFYTITGAGLMSNVTELTITILNSDFKIEVADIEYTPNASGWTDKPIPVYVTVPTDSKAIRNHQGEVTGYTVPTTKYTFYYSPVNIGDVEYPPVEGEFYKSVDGEEGRSIYVFMLKASADSPFSIYARNGAGKKSSNTYVGTENIKIDVLMPVTEMKAYIFPETGGADTVYITSGDWVNGRINLTIRVKDGVSGVYVKDVEYAKDGMGNPVYNAQGELVWQPPDSNPVRVPDGVENNEDGSRYFIYNIEIGLPDSTVNRMSKPYRFRISTGSGVYKDETFLANIDTTAILFEGIEFETEGSEQVESFTVADNKITTSDVCGEGKIRFVSNSEQSDHFDFEVYDDVTDQYRLIVGNELEFAVPADRRGELVYRFFLVSRAKNYLGIGARTEEYRIIIPYNTLNISINYELITDTISYGETNWVDSNLSVQISLVSDDNGTEKELNDADKLEYLYYYKLIPYSPELNLNEAIQNGDWLLCDNGAYIEVGGKSVFGFEIDFTSNSFYGYIALSVTNKAGYRSSTAGDVNRLLHIDRTTPDLTDMVETQSGTSERSSIEGVTLVTYYSNRPITINPKEFYSRSHITYYYIKVEGSITATLNPTGDQLNGWTPLTKSFTLDSPDGADYAEFRYLFYAVNELGASAGGMTGGSHTSEFRFIVDKSEIGGTLSYNANQDGYFDQSLNMYTFLWKENVRISMFVTSSRTDVKYYYSITDGHEWVPYDDEYYPSGTENAVTLTFNAKYFPDGVNSAFKFKAVNKAGSECLYTNQIYIAIDTMTPEFTLSLKVDGVDYNGGSYTDLTYTRDNWVNKPVTITINPVKVNVSGVKYTYTVKYLRNGTPEETDPKEVPSTVSFTTDRLDGFGINRDAIVTIRATSRADGSKYYEVPVRIKVDQVVPEFTLVGIASQEDNSSTKTIYSGDWTNFPRVTISKAPATGVRNVSNVAYVYIHGDTVSDWPEGDPIFGSSTTITVRAKTDAGLVYEREFKVNIDTDVPIIKFVNSESISIKEGEEHFIDLRVVVDEDNIEICEYITILGETRGFAFDPSGFNISTSSVDNSERYHPETGEPYRGYVKIYVKDYAGNTATFEFYMLPFKLDVNNVTLSDADQKTIAGYESDLNAAMTYMTTERVTYFRNLISRLKDRINTLRNEIDSYRSYLQKLAQRTSFELKSDYKEMYEYLETFNNYKLFGQEWIQGAITGDSSSEYYGYYKNLLLQFGVLQAQMNSVFNVEDEVTKLPAINMVEADDYNDILTVYAHYTDLTSDQKACFTTNLYTKLLALKKKCEILLLADEDTGVSVNAEFSPMAKINVETFSEQSEYYVNAQTAILNTITNTTLARAVVSIYRVSLVGAASQTSTGRVTVNLPIPENYRQYVKFAVYEMGTDGTISPVGDMEIEGDGKSVTFSSEKLTTYILAVRANIETVETKDDVYGTFLGLDLDVKMIKTIAIVAIALFAVILVVVIIAGIRHRRFLNSYNRAYKSGIYRRGIQQIPKGNTRPRTNPLQPNDRVRDKKDAF